MGLFNASDIWIVALGKTTVHSLWIGLLIVALLRFILLHIPDKFSDLRYGISVSALLLLFTSVIATFILLYKPSVASHQAYLPTDLISSFSGKFTVQDPGYTGIGIHRIFIIFGQVYFAGVITMLMRSVVFLFHVRNLRTSGTPVAPEWHSRLSLISKSLGIRRSVDILESVRIKVPLLAGALRPVIIVPAGMVTNLPFNQVETIMMHELSHLKRKDYLVNIMQLFIEGILFYHPTVWIISGLVRDEREHCCDDEVLRMTDNPVNYARALIHIAEYQHFSRLVPGATGTGKHHLKFRINRILNIQTMKTNIRDKVISLSLVAVTVIIFLFISSFSAGPSFIRTGVMKSEMISQQDTIPQEKQVKEAAEINETDMKAEVEAARQEALKEIDEIDWDKVKKDLEEAREEFENIDMEQMKADMESARKEALKEIQEIDWEKLEAERQKAIQEIKEIDWDEMKLELQNSLSDIEIDIDRLKVDIQNSMKDIDWEAIRKDIEKSMESLDSIRIELRH